MRFCNRVAIAVRYLCRRNKTEHFMEKLHCMMAFCAILLGLGSSRAQDLRGVVRDADNQPLVGASVYWAGTTIGASTDAEGAFLLHRVRG